MVQSGRSAGNGSNARPAASFGTILKSRIRQPQFYWFLGHLMTVYHFLRFHLSFFSSTSQKYHYKMMLIYIIMTYGIVLYQFWKSKQLKLSNWGNFQSKLRKLDNLQYFVMLSVLLLCYLVSSGGVMITGAIYSPTIFSLFHLLNYFKENLLPFMPIQPMIKNILRVRINSFITNYNGQFLIMAQLFEIICTLRSGIMNLPYVFIKFMVSFNLNHLIKMMTIYNYLKFFQLRYDCNEQMRQVFAQMITKIDMLVQARVGDSNMLHNYLKFKQIILQVYKKYI